jgi:peptide/nickel transport system permease protein
MRYLARRLVFYLVAFWSGITLNFFLPRMLPGNPFDAFQVKFQNQLATNPHMLDSLRAEFDTGHGSLLSQYGQYLVHLAHLDFGVSYSQYPTSVNTIIGTALPYTLLLAGLSTFLAFLIGTMLGIITAWRRGSPVDTVLTPFTMFLQSFPPFFVALLILYWFGVDLGWFPLSRAYSDTVNPGWTPSFILNLADHCMMPLAALLISSVGGWLFGMRNVMINILTDDYVLMAEAKGLKNRRVMMMYAARNALLPQITSFAITLGYAVTSLILIEWVFGYPGLGFTLVNAVVSEDYSMMQALFFIIVVGMLLANLIADLLYARLDPRARAQ